MSRRWLCALAVVVGCKGAPAPAQEGETTADKGEHAHGDEHGNKHGNEHGKDDKGHKGHFDHRFKDAEHWAKRFDDPERAAWQKPEHVAAVIGLAEGMVVADIGAGTGYFLPTFSAAVKETGKVVGLDIEPDMVRYMRERATKQGLANVTARLVKPGDPGLEASSVDRIVLVNTWHHIPDRIAYTAMLKQALKPGGLVAIVDYTREAPRGPPPKHRLTPAEVVAELEAGGLRAEILDEELELQYIVVGRLAP